jgi:probable HAF family extracellular repeat protein
MEHRALASKVLLFTLLTQIGVAVWPGCAAAAARYTITDLGTLGGQNSDAYGINASGKVVGVADLPDIGWRAFLWENGAMHDLGTLGGDFSYASGISDSGVVVGRANYDDGWQYHGFVRQDGTMAHIGTFGGDSSGANAVNALGQVVGSAACSRIDSHAFLWEDGVVTDLGVPAGEYDGTTAYGINDSRQIVGKAVIASGHAADAFLWQDGAFQILPDFGGTVTTANDINASGRIVGFAYTPGVSGLPRAVLWEDGAILDLGTLGGNTSEAMAINRTGQVVGVSQIAGGGTFDNHAFIWEGGVMYDLNALIPADSGWVLLRARDINDRGQIVGSGKIGGVSHAFLLTPVPEPSTLGLLGIVLLAAARRLRSSRAAR